MSIRAINWVLQQSNIKEPSDKFLLLVMANYASDEGLAFPKVETLVQKTGLSRRSVYYALKRMQEQGLIADTGARMGTTKQTRVYHLEWADDEPKGASDAALKGATKAGKGAMIAGFNNNITIVHNLKSTLTSTPKRTTSEFLDILRVDPYYEGIDIDAEYERAVQWCEKKKRALTQRFFRDWLGRADRSDLEEDDEPEYSEPEDWNEERLHALLQVYPPAKMPPAPWAHIPLDVRMAVDAQVKVNQANEKKAGDRNAGANGNGSNGSQSAASGIACGSPKNGEQANVATDKTVSEKDIAS